MFIHIRHRVNISQLPQPSGPSLAPVLTLVPCSFGHHKGNSFDSDSRSAQHHRTGKSAHATERRRDRSRLLESDVSSALAQLHAAADEDLLAQLQGLLRVLHELVLLEVVRLVHLISPALGLVIRVRSVLRGSELERGVTRVDRRPEARANVLEHGIRAQIAREPMAARPGARDLLCHAEAHDLIVWQRYGGRFTDTRVLVIQGCQAQLHSVALTDALRASTLALTRQRGDRLCFLCCLTLLLLRCHVLALPCFLGSVFRLQRLQPPRTTLLIHPDLKKARTEVFLR